MAKGSQFEREVCKRLSLWWTQGERDDIFWRSSQSGGRATQRAKSGRKTAGSYGDVTAIDPKGNHFLQIFTVELKRGKSHGNPGDWLDANPRTKTPFLQAVLQAKNSAKQAGSRSWMLISRRDHREAMIYGEVKLLRKLIRKQFYPWAYFAFVFEGKRISFAAYPLELFLNEVHPDAVTLLKPKQNSISRLQVARQTLCNTCTMQT